MSCESRDSIDSGIYISDDERTNKYIYLKTNEDWTNNNKIKYGFTNKPERRLNDSHEEHSYVSQYHSIYEVKETLDYKMPYNKYDDIFTIVIKCIALIMGYQEKYNVELPNCIKFCNKNIKRLPFI